MININQKNGLDLKFKANLSGANFDQIVAWANIEPNDSDLSYQVPVKIEEGFFQIKSDLKEMKLNESGLIKISVQHGDKLYNVWNSEYVAEKNIEIVLEQVYSSPSQIKQQTQPKKVVVLKEDNKKTEAKVESKKVVESVKPAVKSTAKPTKQVTESVKHVESAKPIKSKTEKTNDDKIFKFNEF